jgi:hypothetical protein
MNLIYTVMTVFDEAVKHLDSKAVTAAEPHIIMDGVKSKLEQRQTEKFYVNCGPKARQNHGALPSLVHHRNWQVAFKVQQSARGLEWVIKFISCDPCIVSQ